MSKPASKFVITEHPAFEMKRRGINCYMVYRTVIEQESGEAVRTGRIVLQRRHYPEPPGKVYLVRVVLDVDRQRAEVVTAYRTTRLAKYWKERP